MRAHWPARPAPYLEFSGISCQLLPQDLALPSDDKQDAQRDIGHRDISCVDRASLGHYVYDVEDVESARCRKNDIERCDRSEQGQRDSAKRLPGSGTVDSGGLIEFARNVLETSQEKDHVKTEPFPDIDRH